MVPPTVTCPTPAFTHATREIVAIGGRSPTIVAEHKHVHDPVGSNPINTSHLVTKHHPLNYLN
jgi:hypothetical protein